MILHFERCRIARNQIASCWACRDKVESYDCSAWYAARILMAACHAKLSSRRTSQGSFHLPWDLWLLARTREPSFEITAELAHSRYKKLGIRVQSNFEMNQDIHDHESTSERCEGPSLKLFFCKLEFQFCVSETGHLAVMWQIVWGRGSWALDSTILRQWTFAMRSRLRTATMAYPLTFWKLDRDPV